MVKPCSRVGETPGLLLRAGSFPCFRPPPAVSDLCWLICLVRDSGPGECVEDGLLLVADGWWDGLDGAVDGDGG